MSSPLPNRNGVFVRPVSGKVVLGCKIMLLPEGPDRAFRGEIAFRFEPKSSGDLLQHILQHSYEEFCRTFVYVCARMCLLQHLISSMIQGKVFSGTGGALLLVRNFSDSSSSCF